MQSNDRSVTAPGDRRERTRLALLQAGAEVFASRGFRGASLDEVAEAAGYTKGAIYDHFGSKDDFFFAVVDHRASERFAHFEELIAGVVDAGVEVLTKQVAEGLYEMLRPGRRGALLDAEAWLYAQREEAARARLAEHQAQSVQRVTDLLQSVSADTGVTLSMPARDLAIIVIGATQGVTHMALTDPDLDVGSAFQNLTALGWSETT